MTYDIVADEYYDSYKHPTCHNFRSGSRSLIGKHLSKLRPVNVLEVGAGNSIVAELLTSSRTGTNGRILNNLVISDASQKMLRHSEKYRKLGAIIKILDAENLNIPDNIFDLIVASLGDPYNTDKFWSEVSRILTPKGKCIFTTPSHSWSLKYRGTVPTAHFIIGDNSIHLRSQVLCHNEQERMINAWGLKVDDVSTFRFEDVRDGIVSPKIKLGDSNLPIVTCFLISKRNG